MAKGSVGSGRQKRGNTTIDGAHRRLPVSRYKRGPRRGKKTRTKAGQERGLKRSSARTVPNQRKESERGGGGSFDESE